LVDFFSLALLIDVSWVGVSATRLTVGDACAEYCMSYVTVTKSSLLLFGGLMYSTATESSKAERETDIPVIFTCLLYNS